MLTLNSVTVATSTRGHWRLPVILRSLSQMFSAPLLVNIFQNLKKTFEIQIQQEKHEASGLLPESGEEDRHPPPDLENRLDSVFLVRMRRQTDQLSRIVCGVGWAGETVQLLWDLLRRIRRNVGVEHQSPDKNVSSSDMQLRMLCAVVCGRKSSKSKQTTKKKKRNLLFFLPD